MNSRVGEGDGQVQFSVLPLLRHSLLLFFAPARVSCVPVQWLWCVWTSVKYSGRFSDKDDFSFSFRSLFETYISKSARSQKADFYHEVKTVDITDETQIHSLMFTRGNIRCRISKIYQIYQNLLQRRSLHTVKYRHLM